MDDTFLIGSAAFLAAMLVFVGSVWLLMALVLGPRLSYLVTATVTLGFVFIMALVWSYGDPLGPVGDLPAFEPVDIGEDAGGLNFGPAASYPEGDWRAPNEDDEEEISRSTELETAVMDYLETEIRAGELETFEPTDDVQVDPDKTRLLDQDGTLYGAATIEPIPAGTEGAGEEEQTAEGEVVAVMHFEPGDPSGPARVIAAGTFVVLAGHLFFLSKAEKRARRKKEEEEEEEAART
jgi:hypothetical protein